MIVPATTEHLEALLSLWAGYQGFYKVQNIDEVKNRAFIEDILLRPDAGLIHVVIQDGIAVGFSTLYFTYASTAVSQVAVLNDLYVDPAYRQQGLARQLLDHAQQTVKDLDIPVLRWMTQESNSAAQKLYEQYSKPSEWLLYSVIS